MEDRTNSATACPSLKGLVVCSGGKTQPELTTEAKGTGDQVLVQNSFNITLHQACEEGRLDVVKYILSHGLEDINSRGKMQRTPVMVAALKGQVAVLNYLINHDCDLSALDHSKNNVLHLACMDGNIDIVRKLIVNKSCDIESRGSKGRRPIMWAAYYGHREVFELLTDKDCDLKAADDQNYNILHLACLGGKVDMVQYILSQNIIGIESKGHHERTPVMTTALKGREKVFQFLEEAGCNLTTVDDQNNNILHIAAFSGHFHIVKYIVSRHIVGIDSRGYRGRTPVMKAAEKGRKGVFAFLVNRGCDLTTLDDNKNNILHVACWGGQVDMVKHLMTLRAVKGMKKAKNKFDRTPVQVAERLGHVAVVSLLNP